MEGMRDAECEELVLSPPETNRHLEGGAVARNGIASVSTLSARWGQGRVHTRRSLPSWRIYLPFQQQPSEVYQSFQCYLSQVVPGLVVGPSADLVMRQSWQRWSSVSLSFRAWSPPFPGIPSLSSLHSPRPPDRHVQWRLTGAGPYKHQPTLSGDQTHLHPDGFLFTQSHLNFCVHDRHEVNIFVPIVFCILIVS